MSRASDGRRGELAARLRTVRATAFRSGQRLAVHLGWPQSRVSKLETGAQLPTEDDIRAWVTATRASSKVRAELLEMLAAARVEYVNDRQLTRRGGLVDYQARLAHDEASTSRLASWQISMIPGLLQTPAYVRELLSNPKRPRLEALAEAEIDGLIAERMRRQEILYLPDRRVELYVGEAALHAAPGTADTMLGQLDRLATLATLNTIQLGIVPLDATLIAPLSGFALRDNLVVLETMTGEHLIDDPEEVAVYVQALDALHEAALFGDDAVALIKRVIAELSGR